jgi:hypothetical protein
MKPEDLFRAEKERAVSARNSQHARLLAEAKAAFDKLMAEGQAARKSGRPRKHPLPPLKTSSSRTPVKPAAPIQEVRAAPVKPVAPTPRPTKPEVRVAAKSTKKTTKAKTDSAPRRAAAKKKPKAKRSTRR